MAIICTVHCPRPQMEEIKIPMVRGSMEDIGDEEVKEKNDDTIFTGVWYVYQEKVQIWESVKW